VTVQLGHDHGTDLVVSSLVPSLPSLSLVGGAVVGGQLGAAQCVHRKLPPGWRARTGPPGSPLPRKCARTRAATGAAQTPTYAHVHSTDTARTQHGHTHTHTHTTRPARPQRGPSAPPRPP
jgi:hypothetical protein